jgi:DNA replication protein DnaC
MDGIMAKVEARPAPVAKAEDPRVVVRSRWEAWGIPLRVRDAIDAGLERNGAMTALERLTGRNSDTFVTLLGEPGAGKTCAACWWMTQVPEPKRSDLGRPMYVASAQIGEWEPWGDELAQARRARALVLDDLGVEMVDAKNWFRAKIDRLIEARYSAMLPTVITTNLEIETIADRVGERVMSRLGHGGVLVVMDKQYRRRK